MSVHRPASLASAPPCTEDTASRAASLRISPYQPGDEAAILDCMRECFNFAPQAERWRHLYVENPAGAPIIFLAWHREMVVGHAALLPRSVRALHQHGVAGQSVDAMTRLAWRRRGIRERLASECRQVAAQRGFVAIFSFANPQGLGGALRQGRRRVDPLRVLVRPVRPVHAAFALAAARLQAVRPSGAVPVAMPDCAVAGPIGDDDARWSGEASGWSRPAFDERHTLLFRAAEALPPISLVRDATHLNWRYTAAPGDPYRQRNVCSGRTVQATIVVRFVRLFGVRLAVVMEWFWQPGARAAALDLVRDVVYLARASRADGVAALTTGTTAQQRLLVRLGFLPVPQVLHPKSVTFTVGPTQATPTAEWFDASSWYLTWGDGFIL